MNTNPPILSVKSFICLAAAAVCAVLSGPAQANDHEVVTVNISISTTGLDLSQPTVVRELYRRIQRASSKACRDGDRVGLEPPTSFTGCYERSLGDAVHSAHRPELSIVYLATHTPGDAAIYGIEVPVQMAAK